MAINLLHLPQVYSQAFTVLLYLYGLRDVQAPGVCRGSDMDTGEMWPQVYPCDLSPCGMELGIGSEVAELWASEQALPVSPLFKHEAKVSKDFKFELGLRYTF